MKLRKARKARGWTQVRLAEAAGVRQVTISQLETGRIKNPSFNLIAKLATALGVGPYDIWGTRSRRRLAAVRIGPVAPTVTP